MFQRIDSAKPDQVSAGIFRLRSSWVHNFLSSRFKTLSSESSHQQLAIIGIRVTKIIFERQRGVSPLVNTDVKTLIGALPGPVSWLQAHRIKLVTRGTPVHALVDPAWSYFPHPFLLTLQLMTGYLKQYCEARMEELSELCSTQAVNVQNGTLDKCDFLWQVGSEQIQQLDQTDDVGCPFYHLQ